MNLLVAAASPTEVWAAEAASADKMTAAKTYFVKGQALYGQAKYEAALASFSSAYELVQLPDLLFNMARCEAKIGRNAEAAKHYREFLQRSPNDPEAPKIQAEITRLDEAVAQAEAAQAATRQRPAPTVEPSTPPSSEPTARRLPIITISAGAGAVVLLIAGAATLGYVGGQYNDLKDRCDGRCDPSEWTGLRSASYAGYTLLGLSAAAAVAAAVALPFELKKSRERKLALTVGPGSLGAVGRF